MKKERIKNIVLFCLIFSSLVLTAQLLFGLPSLETAKPPAYEQLTFGELRRVSSQILPKIQLQTDSGWRQARPWEADYDKVWAEAQRVLPAARQAEPAEEIPDLAEFTLIAAFPVSVPPAAYGAEFLNGIETDTFAWRQEEPGILWLRQPNGVWLQAKLGPLLRLAENLAGAAQTLPEYYRAEADKLALNAKDVILLPLAVPEMAPRQIINEELDTEKLVRSIFVDTALVRRIEERDGAFIYTDGQKGLRLFHSGEVELTSPHSEPGSELLEVIPALRRTAQYLQLLGGWGDNLYISQLQRETNTAYLRRQWDTYTVTLISAGHGTRIISTKPPVKLRFCDRGVIYYNRKIRELDEETDARRPLIDPYDAVHTVALALENDNSLPELTDIYPAYYMRDPAFQPTQAAPVWGLAFADGRTAVVHGYTGNLITWLK